MLERLPGIGNGRTRIDAWPKNHCRDKTKSWGPTLEKELSFDPFQKSLFLFDKIQEIVFVVMGF